MPLPRSRALVRIVMDDGAWVGTARLVALAIAIGFAAAALGQVHGHWWFQDANAYWNAGSRLLHAEALYPLAQPDASDTYRYAPWFAALWVPLTLLPYPVVMIVWTGVLTTAVGFCLWPLAVHRSLASGVLAIIMGGLLLPVAASGNVQPLLLATLVWGLRHPSGPLWVALAASLKAAPILLVAVWIGRRQWVKAAVAMGATALLVAPMLVFDLSHYSVAVGAATGPLDPVPMAVLAGICVLAALPLGGTRYAWLAAATGVLLAIPRWSYYQATFLLAGLIDE